MKRWTLVFALVLGLFAQEGHAEIITLTDFGTVSSSGPEYYFGTDIRGISYTRTITIDTSAPGASFEDIYQACCDSWQRSLTGGTSFVDYSITFGSATSPLAVVSGTGAYHSALFVDHDTQVPTTASFLIVGAMDYPNTTPAVNTNMQLAVPISYLLPAGRSFVVPGTYFLYALDNGNNSFASSRTFLGGGVSDDVRAILVPEQLVITVPEPNTYFMMLVGLALLAIVTRYRRPRPM